MLRNIPAMQFVFAKFAALLRSDKASGKPPISKFLGEAPDVTGNTVDQQGTTGLRARPVTMPRPDMKEAAN
jgi:hypothetical protein